MLKEAMEKLLSLSKPVTFTHKERIFVDPVYQELKQEHAVNSLKAQTLTGLVDYVHSHFDTDRELMIHIESPTKVSVFDCLNDSGDRRTYIKAEALLPDISFGRMVERESFQIMLQANFCESPEKIQMLNIVSRMNFGEGTLLKDNGITQEVTVKSGVELLTVDLKEKYRLMPFRTFVEIEQPPSDFIFRVKEDSKNIYCGIFEADGGAWELNAMHSIKKYLEAELEDLIETGDVRIIS